MDDKSTRTDALKATNNTLTSSAEDLRQRGRDYPVGREGEQVRTGSPDHVEAPGYAAPPGRNIDRDADPAAPADAHVGDRTNPDAAGSPMQSGVPMQMGDEPALDLAPGALTTDPDRDAVSLAPGAMTTNGNAPPTAGSSGYLDHVYEGDHSRATTAKVPPSLPADAKDARGARVDRGDQGETFPHGRTRLDPGREQHVAQEPQIKNEPNGPFPPQHQGTPGLESELIPRPQYMAPLYKAAGKLAGKVALITGGDSGIGRAVAVLYAREGADVAIVYLPAEQTDALETQRAVENAGRRCLLLPGDLTEGPFCNAVVEQTVTALGKLDILVSNAAHQNRKPSLDAITDDEFDETFKTNVYAYFRLCRAALPHLKPGASIIATSSETGIMGSKQLLDYSATKGAINAFTKALAQQLVEKGIRVNAVAPGPVWTPLNPADQGMTPQKVAEFGSKSPMKRPAQPEEIAPAYVFLASDADSSFVTGIILQEMGGETTGG